MDVYIWRVYIPFFIEPTVKLDLMQSFFGARTGIFRYRNVDETLLRQANLMHLVSRKSKATAGIPIIKLNVLFCFPEIQEALVLRFNFSLPECPSTNSVKLHKVSIDNYFATVFNQDNKIRTQAHSDNSRLRIMISAAILLKLRRIIAGKLCQKN